MSNRGYQQGPLTPEIQEQIASSELLRKTELRRQGVAPSVNQQPLSSTPSTSEPAPSTTAVSLHDTPDSPHSEHGPGAQGGSKGLFEGRPYGIGDLSGDQLAEITGDDRDKNPVGDYTRTLPDGTEVNVTRQGDGQYHIAPIASAEGSPEQDEPTTEDDWGSLPSSDPKVAEEEWGSLPGGGYAHGGGQGERDDEFGDDGGDDNDDEPKWMSYPDGPQQERVAEREGAASFGSGAEDGEEGARAAEAQRRDLGERRRMA